MMPPPTIAFAGDANGECEESSSIAESSARDRVEWAFADSKSLNFRGLHCLVFYRHHHSQRKPLAKSRSEKRPTLTVETARNSLSQWPTPQNAPANPRKCPRNCVRYIFFSVIRDLLAEREGFEPLLAYDRVFQLAMHHSITLD